VEIGPFVCRIVGVEEDSGCVDLVEMWVDGSRFENKRRGIVCGAFWSYGWVSISLEMRI